MGIIDLAVWGPGAWSLLTLGLTAVLLAGYPAVEGRLTEFGARYLGKRPLILYYVFFPGTVIHEASHLVACILLGVRVGRVNLFGPEPGVRGGYTLGYVEHARTGPLRGTLVGLAPVFGCALCTYAAFLWAAGLPVLQPLTPESLAAGVSRIAGDPLAPASLAFSYLAASFAISGTPSRSDLRSVPAAVALLGALAGVAFAFRGAVDWAAAADAAGSAAFLVPPLMLVCGVLAFEVAVLLLAWTALSLAVMAGRGRRPA